MTLDAPPLVARASSWLSAQSASFEQTLHVRAGVRVWALALVCGCIALAILLTVVPVGLSQGDAPLYADQIAHLDLGSRTVHIGYMLLGIGFTRLLPLDLDLALNVMAALFGALSVVVVSLLAYTLTGKLAASLAAAGTLLTFWVFAVNATLAEVYGPQLFFFLLCVLLILWDKPIATGLSFAAAFLISPSVVLALPFLMLLRPKGSFILRVALTAALPVILIVAPHYQDFLFGGRGLILVKTVESTSFDLARGLSKEAQELVGFYAALVFIAVGLYTLAASRMHRLLCVGLVIMWALYLLLGEAFTVGEAIGAFPVQLPLYGMFAVFSGIGFARLLYAFKSNVAVQTAVTVLLLGSFSIAGYNSYSRLGEFKLDVYARRQAIEAMRAQAGSNDMYVANFPSGVLVEHYLRNAPMDWIALESLVGAADSPKTKDAMARVQNAVSSGKRVWLVGQVSNGQIAAFEQVGYGVSSFGTGVYVAQRRNQ